MDITEARKIAYEFPNVRFVHDQHTDRWRFEDPHSDDVTDAVPIHDMPDEEFIKRIEQASREFAELHGEAPFGWATCRSYRPPSV